MITTHYFTPTTTEIKFVHCKLFQEMKHYVGTAACFSSHFFIQASQIRRVSTTHIKVVLISLFMRADDIYYISCSEQHDRAVTDRQRAEAEVIMVEQHNVGNNMQGNTIYRETKKKEHFTLRGIKTT